MELYKIGKTLILETVSRDKILSALRNRNVVTFWYDDPDEGEGVKPGYREVEPYVYGKHYISGNDVVRAWLIRGVSKTGEIDPSLVPGWRLFRVDRMGNWLNNDNKFEPYTENGSPVRNKYNPDDKHMTGGRGRIFYSIKPGEPTGTDVEKTQKKSWWQRAKEKIKSIFNEEYSHEDIELLD